MPLSKEQFIVTYDRFMTRERRSLDGLDDVKKNSHKDKERGYDLDVQVAEIIRVGRLWTVKANGNIQSPYFMYIGSACGVAGCTFSLILPGIDLPVTNGHTVDSFRVPEGMREHWQDKHPESILDVLTLPSENPMSLRLYLINSAELQKQLNNAEPSIR